MNVLPFPGSPAPDRSGRGPAYTVAQVIDRFLRHAAKDAAPRTQETRERVLGLFRAAFGSKLLGDCIPADLDGWIDDHAEWASNWTKRRNIAYVQSAFNWAARMRLIRENPFRGVTRRKGKRGRPATEAEWRTLLRATTAPFRRVLFFLALTGCRPGEAAALKWEQVNLDSGVAVLEDHKSSRTRSDPTPRIIVLPPVLVRLLRWLRRRQPTAEYVLLHYRNGPWNRYSLSCRMKRLRRTCGLPAECKLYGLRHGFGTKAVINGVDLKTLSVLMGHASTQMTEYYTHLAGQLEHLRAAAKRATHSPPPAR